jgi:hypothetical protein
MSKYAKIMKLYTSASFQLKIYVFKNENLRRNYELS